MRKTFKPKVEVKALNGGNGAIVHFPEKMKVLASTLRNGGFVEADTVLIIQVERGYDGQDPDEDMRKTCHGLGLKEDTVCFMTAADVKKVISTTEEEYHGVKASVVATAGVVNAVMAGELVPDAILATLTKPGTINIVAAVNVPLEPAGLANAIITITEAKTAAMIDCGVKGTGTTSDAVAVACPKGNGSHYAGTATDVGIALSRAVRKAVGQSIRKWYNGTAPLDMLSRLQEKGISLDDLWNAAKELYYSNPQWETEMIHQRFMAHIKLLNDDVNVNAMVQAALLMEEQGGRDNIHGLGKGEFAKDPVHLLADELMGIALAEYISGTRGLFEYTRYDRKKPGIIGELGPFMDDIVGALVGGTMSKVYTDLLGAGR
ncbi:MAG: bifunctional adenosylcobinamide hydrolase/alpha-ribazole phosphatase CbiS [Methanomassiliicoccales archaeon]|nr:bifunctional adenosylcobinamide hydrolase/alpha-ribazole phosphatase CbiS [Methanomassiliicoccales archaeon]